MPLGKDWTRRRFLAISGGAAAAGLTGFGDAQGDGIPRDATAAQAANLHETSSVMPPPGVITGGTRPLLEGMTARPLRYSPVGGEFVIRNGREFFNRPIYGPNNDFRVDAGDLPEFSFYLPGHGGNLKLGFIAADGAASKWSASAGEVIARYRPGRMIYEIRDPLLGSGTLRAELLTAATGSGLMLKVEGQDIPSGVRLAWAFGGVSGKKGKRNGDIGCEVEPVSEFFQLRQEECAGNSYTLEHASSDPPVVLVHMQSKAAEMDLIFPRGSSATILDFVDWNHPPRSGAALEGALHSSQPFLYASVTIESAPLYVSIQRTSKADQPPRATTAQAFLERSAEVEAIASRLRVETPDECLNVAAAAIGIAADTLWDAKQECVMHGGVAWRVPLAGWRGPYSLDALGDHDRAKLHFRHWIKRQNETPVAGSDPATGPADPNIHLARKEALLHSNGDLSNNHYDMNLVFFDVLLRHLMWTGDLEFAREVWPALERHLAWEHRLFRRTYPGAAGADLPLYEAYAAIWASDNLQYNGGGATHSSAYMVFALRKAAQIAALLGEDGSAYAAEAARVDSAMHQLLWQTERGLFAESKDILGPRTVYTNPALWTVYHAIDSEVPDRRQAWQMCAERLLTLKLVPIHGEGVPAGAWYLLACSNWMPYVWSLNLLVLAEDIHMALALWQAGMREEAWRLFKGNLLDSMYMGLCPGDFHMSSALDVHRQEAQRDFGDPVGICSRAIVEGLFGVQPDLLKGTLRVKPGFPAGWDRASLKHRDFDLEWRSTGLRDTYILTSRLSKITGLLLEVPALTTSLPTVTNGSQWVGCEFDNEAVGSPMLRVQLPPAASFHVEITWHGRGPVLSPAARAYRVGDHLDLPGSVKLAMIEDPQGCLKSGRIVSPGAHTVFSRMHDADCSWLMPISFSATQDPAAFAPVPILRAPTQTQQLDLSSVLDANIPDIFTRGYTTPRSPYCSLSIPDTLLGGWANPDGMARIDDTGLRQAGGLLETPVGIRFRTPPQGANCVFLSHWGEDRPALSVPLGAHARGIYLLMAGTTLPQCSRMQHGTVTVAYTDGKAAFLPLRNPENWWPIEQDYLLDDYLFVNDAPLPPRVDLRNGKTRLLDSIRDKGRGRMVPGGAATILHLPLDPAKELSTLKVECELYGVVLGLLAATVVRV